MTDLAALGLTVQSDGLLKATGTLDQFKAASDKASAGADKLSGQSGKLDGALRKLDATAGGVDTALVQVGNAAGVASGKIGGGFANSMRGVSQQLSQVGQQTMATGNFVQALAILLPDIGLAFGVWGTAIGLVAGIALSALTNALGGAGASAAALKADIENLSNTVSTYRTAVDDANLSTSEMRLAFGDANFAVGETLALLREIAAGDAQDAIDAVNTSLSELLQTAGDGDRRAELANFFDVNIFLAFTDAQRAAREEARLLTSQFREQQYELALSKGNIDAQIAAMSNLLSTTRQLANATDGVNEKERALITSMRDALSAMVEQKRTMGEVKTELERAKEAAIDLFNTAASNDWLSGAIGRAATLAEALWGAARAAAAVVSQPAPVEVGGGRGRGPGGPLVNTAEQELASVGQVITYAAPNSGSGGGGGAARVDEYTEAQKRALAVIADMNEAAVTQADVISALEVMHQSGAIGADQLATAIANVKEQMADVDKVSFDLAGSIGNVFTDALTGVKSLQDGIKDLLGSMAELFLNAAFQKFLPTLLPGIDFGGFRAAGGPVSGGRSYIVGENGPELFTPGRSGGITPNHAMGGGAGTSVQINNYSGAPVREQRSRGPDGRELIKVIVGEELGTGGYDKQLGRYGASPAKVRR